MWLADIAPDNNGEIEVCFYQKKKQTSSDMVKCAKLLYARIMNGAKCEAEISEDENIMVIKFKKGE